MCTAWKPQTHGFQPDTRTLWSKTHGDPKHLDDTAPQVMSETHEKVLVSYRNQAGLGNEDFNHRSLSWICENFNNFI